VGWGLGPFCFGWRGEEAVGTASLYRADVWGATEGRQHPNPPTPPRPPLFSNQPPGRPLHRAALLRQGPQGGRRGRVPPLPAGARRAAGQGGRARRSGSEQAEEEAAQAQCKQCERNASGGGGGIYRRCAWLTILSHSAIPAPRARLLNTPPTAGNFPWLPTTQHPPPQTPPNRSTPKTPPPRLASRPPGLNRARPAHQTKEVVQGITGPVSFQAADPKLDTQVNATFFEFINKVGGPSGRIWGGRATRGSPPPLVGQGSVGGWGSFWRASLSQQCFQRSPP
jgi:hypothetical protein